MARADRRARSLLGAAILAGCAPPVAPPASPAAMPAVRAAASGGMPIVEPPMPAPPARPERPRREKPAPAPSTIALAKEPVVEEILRGGGAALKTVMTAPEKYRFQVLYGIVEEGPKPTLERHGYRADAEYFFPASSMKVPIALATYEWLAKQRITREATLRIHPVAGSGEPYVTTVAREAWRALIVSDNFSANRLLGIVGHREAHETLWSFGLASTRIRTGFATGAEIDPAEVSPRIEVAASGRPTTEIGPRRSDLVLPPTDAKDLDIGKAAIVDGRRKEGPLSFADKNAMTLRDLQDTLVRIVRPDLLPEGARADAVSKEDLAHLRQALGTLPSQSGLAGYDRNVVADYQLSPFLRGIERVRPRGRFEIYAKVGQAYGFLVANAYVVDKESGRSFFLTAAVFANPNDVMNDDNYGYDTTSFPALADVGEAFCRHAFE